MGGIIVLIGVIWLIYLIAKEPTPTPTQIQQQRTMNRNMICPHCQMQGFVTTKQVKRKQGIHGGKATAAILTCGISMIGTGLSRKQKMTEAHCNNCGVTWAL